MAKISFKWLTPGAPATQSAGSYGATKANDAKGRSIGELLGLTGEQAKRPIFLYVESRSSEHHTNAQKIESTCFKDERVMIGAKYFTSVRSKWDDVSEPLAKALGVTTPTDELPPTMFFFQADGKRSSVLDAHHSPSKIASAMDDVVKREFRGSLFDTVKKVQRILTQLDKLDALMKTLELAAAKPNNATSKVDEIERKRKEYSEEKAALDEQERSIWKQALTLRSEPAPRSTPKLAKS